MSPKPYTLSFRLRSTKHTLNTYQEVYMLLRVGTDAKMAIITGFRVERADWFALEGQRHTSRNFIRCEAIETRLEAMRSTIDMIYRYQSKKAQIEGWRMTTRSVIRQFQGLPFIPTATPIRPCLTSWVMIRYQPLKSVDTGRVAQL